MELIIAGGNDYVIAVKANQKRLYQQIQLNTTLSVPKTTYTSKEKTRDRSTIRTVSVFDDLTGISPQWMGLAAVVKVERTGTRHGKSYQQVGYYISSLDAPASVFAHGIRAHWRIENQLHWVKDVVFGEDNSQITQGHAPANFSIIRSITINLLRKHGYSSVTTAQRLIANDLDQLYLLLE